MAPVAKAKPETPEVDIIEPVAAQKVYTIGPEKEITLVQKPLSFFGKIELFALFGSAIEKALSGDASLGQILGSNITERGATLSASDFQDADEFLMVVGRLSQYAPDLLLNLYCITLGVPKGQRDYVKAVMELPEDDGGLSDEQGMAIFNTFIDQNWDVMVDFFKNQAVPLVQKIQKKLAAFQ
jgi:hypothetical protein